MAQAPRRVRVCIAEDHVLVREGLRLLVNNQHDMVVLCEASDGCDALRLAALHRPDVLITDLSMPHGNGLDAIPQIVTVSPETSVVVLSVHEEQAYVRRALNAGAKGYVLKRSASIELIHAIRRVLAGATYVDPALAARAVLAPGRRAGSPPARSLTDRERQIVTLVASGFSNNDVAQRLGISVKTVETHKSRIMAKMRFASRAELVRYALAEGLLADADGRRGNP